MKTFNSRIILILIFSSYINIIAQVGINTANPQATLHVDGAKDNNILGAPTTNQQMNDFVITSSGNLGVGTIMPSQKLEIQTGGTQASPITGFKLADGNQFTNYVLTSNANGIGTWKQASLTSITGTFIPLGASNKITFQTQPNQFYTTGAYIDLPPGLWKVDIILLLQHSAASSSLPVDTWLWLKASFSDNNADGLSILTTDLAGPSNRLASTLFQGPSTGEKNGILQGTLLVKNTTTIVKRYYLIVGDTSSQNPVPGAFLKNVGSSEWGENSMIAYPMSQ